MALSSEDIADKLSAKKQRRENRAIRAENAQERTDSGHTGKLTDMFGINFDEGGQFKLNGGDTYSADFDALRDSQDFKKMALETFGTDVVKSKLADGGQFSDSFIDSVLDRNAPKVASVSDVEAEPYVPSETYTVAKENVDRYEDELRNSSLASDLETPGSNFMKDYTFNIKSEMFPQSYNSALRNLDALSVQPEAPKWEKQGGS